MTRPESAPIRVLLLTLNHSPEPVGIGPYSAEMAAYLRGRGMIVDVVCAKPYYPAWSVDPAYRDGGYRRSIEDGVAIVRCPLYVPANPSGARRIVHHLSFAISALRPMLSLARRRRPDVVMAIAPGLLSAPVALAAARLAGARSWLHIQDFEVEAALATGLLKPGGLGARAALFVERQILRRFDRLSSISPKMCAKLVEKGLPADHVMEFRNWADIDAVRPSSQLSPYRAEWGIDQTHVALYSGNVANKQGIDIIVDAAQRLRHRDDLLFAICGQGSYLETLKAQAAGLANVRFFPLQPKARLDELMRLATVHLLPQLADAADLVLPSKLTNMLSSGRPVIATVAPGTDLAHEIAGCGIATPPGDATALAAAIERLIADPQARAAMGATARARAEAAWSKVAILAGLHARLTAVARVPPAAGAATI